MAEPTLAPRAPQNIADLGSVISDFRGTLTEVDGLYIFNADGQVTRSGTDGEALTLPLSAVLGLPGGLVPTLSNDATSSRPLLPTTLLTGSAPSSSIDIGIFSSIAETLSSRSRAASATGSSTTVSDPGSSGGLTTGAIVGIAVGATLGFLVIVGIVGFCLWRRYHSRRKNVPPDVPAAHAATAAPHTNYGQTNYGQPTDKVGGAYHPPLPAELHAASGQEQYRPVYAKENQNYQTGPPPPNTNIAPPVRHEMEGGGQYVDPRAQEWGDSASGGAARYEMPAK